MRQLICEGPCNPTIEMVDARVRTWTKTLRRCDPVGDRDVWAQQRALRHTVHVATTREDQYRCATCGHVRQFGGGRPRGV